ncbi:XrtN system VIT domain-containing protein [Rufibacter hautae]|uniref:XrtN system VIT domain-containing protein n=1 Tax=Rufibacter hautae TaxID=2595005 RepID=A0A5B6THJ1_9BACT|nr:XrtN system VIT domain-containing protein [Rufibacter hautae]KAA3438660.1 XrtN system VIT domain-containing protein [Rufibacter hautae]
MNFETQSTLSKPTPEETSPQLTKKPLLLTGFILIIISYSIFLLKEWRLWEHGESFGGIFLFNYLIAAGYFLTLVFRKFFRFKEPLQMLNHLMLFLVLGLISDFALNKEMKIFLPSVDWFTGWLILTSLAMMGYSFRSLLPRALQLTMVFLLGTGVVLFSYFSLYLAPYYFVGAIGAIALGIGLHIFIPLCSAIAVVVAVKRMSQADTTVLRTFVSGISVTLLFALVYLSLWQSGVEKVNRILNSYQVQENQDLPRWVALSQQVPTTPIFERIVQSDLVYQTASETFDVFGMPNRQFEEQQRHDPMVVVATRLFRKPDLSTQERVKIMESRFNARHLAQERLWSGTHLSTSNVITQAQIFPQHRFSYTEKILTVYNNHASNWGQEEAIYTFQLPEGSVVTSLSLWINGREEKGYLTTQSKADSAYKTVVGVEARDPSVVHWQEGNTVSVRVFPCTPQESRQFKIGVTSPLRLEGGNLVYENIFFDGPSPKNAAETAIIRVEGDTVPADLPSGFEPTTLGRFERYGAYSPDWKFKVKASNVSPAGFAFEGQTYHMQPHKPEYEPFQPTRVYLDLNKSWTLKEFTSVWAAVKGAKVYAYGSSMTKLTPENHLTVFQLLQEQNFSLFPLHLVKDPEQALIISKSTGNSPNLKDLEGSRFADEFAKTASKQKSIRLFHLTGQPSPYLRTLKELRLIQFAQGSSAELAQLLTEKKFVRPDSDPNAVVLDEAQIKISRTPSTATSQLNGPDHLMRLFAYNHLLQQIGPKYFQKDFLETNLIEEAAQANVVSPLSSLVVLETKKDYERFGIEESKNSLGNASVKSSGAVPEPHEWALIIIVLLVVSISVLKPRLLS